MIILYLLLCAVAFGGSSEPLLVSVREAAEMLGVSIRTAAKLVDSGELRSLKIGRRRLVPVAAVHELIAERLAC
jgi:excisionase family DNA binding protein